MLKLTIFMHSSSHYTCSFEENISSNVVITILLCEADLNDTASTLVQHIVHF